MDAIHTRHTFLEKLFFRSTILGSYAVGAYTIFLSNPIIGLAYILLTAISLELLVYRFCRHCPYPCNHSTCLMMPHQMVTKYRDAGKGSPTIADRATFPLVMLVMLPLIPQYWLFQHKLLLAIFWLATIAAWVAMLLLKCRRCLYKECFFNHINHTP